MNEALHRAEPRLRPATADAGARSGQIEAWPWAERQRRTRRPTHVQRGPVVRF